MNVICNGNGNVGIGYALVYDLGCIKGSDYIYSLQEGFVYHLLLSFCSFRSFDLHYRLSRRLA
jgi:hypothetical protein